MSRVAVVGGAGHMGQRAVKGLLDGGHEVLVIDKRAPATPEVSFAGVDANDHDRLYQTIISAAPAVVMSFVGPYYRFGDAVARVAIRARTPYVDVCDDADVTERLLALDVRAREAGTPVVVGAGISPGVLNGLVQVAARAFDVLDEVVMAWTVGERGESGPAPLDHFFHSTTGLIPVWEEGQRREVAAFSRASAETFPFPAPVGPVEVRDVGHPETVTLPRVIAARSIRNKGALLPARAGELFETLARVGLTSDEPVAVHGTTVTARSFLVAFLTAKHNAHAGSSDDDLAGVGLRIVGVRDGRRLVRHVAFAKHTTMADCTALPAVAAIAQLLDRSVPPGVHGPEVLGPEPWFERIARIAPGLFDDIEVWDDANSSDARRLPLQALAAAL